MADSDRPAAEHNASRTALPDVVVAGASYSAHLKGKMPYAMNGVIEQNHSSPSHKANCAGNQQYCCLWLIVARAWWPRTSTCNAQTHQRGGTPGISCVLPGDLDTRHIGDCAGLQKGEKVVLTRRCPGATPCPSTTKILLLPVFQVSKGPPPVSL